jgi:uncharacterized membrane protein
MELDDLKLLLDTSINCETKRSENEISILLSATAKSLVTKLKRSIWIEIILTIACCLLFSIVVFFNQYWAVRAYFSVFAIIFIPFIIVLILLLQRINILSYTDLPLKQNLEQIHAILKSYIKKAYTATFVLLFFCLLYSCTIAYIETKNNIHGRIFFGFEKSTLSLPFILFVIIYSLGLFTGIHYFAKWYFNKLYGQYLAEMEICINDLDEISETANL